MRSVLIKLSNQVMANGSGNSKIDVGEWRSNSSKVITNNVMMMYLCSRKFYRVMKAYLLLEKMLSLARAHPARLFSGKLLTGQAQKRKQIRIFQSNWVTGCWYVKTIPELSNTLETWIASILMIESMLV